jgi:hypothetical protein
LTFLLFPFPFCGAYKDSGEGSVSDFSGKLIIGALAGTVETSNAYDIKEMDALLKRNNCFKLFEKDNWGGNSSISFQAAVASFDAPALTKSPTAPAAVPRRVGRLLAPMRGSAMLVRPRLVNNRSAGCRLSF